MLIRVKLLCVRRVRAETFFKVVRVVAEGPPGGGVTERGRGKRSLRMDDCNYRW